MAAVDHHEDVPWKEELPHLAGDDTVPLGAFSTKDLITSAHFRRAARNLLNSDALLELIGALLIYKPSNPVPRICRLPIAPTPLPASSFSRQGELPGTSHSSHRH